MDCYDNFKSRLAFLCERGKISKDVKKRFIGGRAEDIREIVYAVGNELYTYFTECKMNDEGFAAVCDAAADLFACFGDSERSFSVEAAIIGAYAKVMLEFNKSGGKEKGRIIKEKFEQYNKALQNIKYGVALFDLKI